jgi:hypothetical protein
MEPLQEIIFGCAESKPSVALLVLAGAHKCADPMSSPQLAMDAGLLAKALGHHS